MATKDCNRCGEKDLVWIETDNGYRLSRNGIVHECDLYEKPEESKKPKNSNPKIANLVKTKNLLKQAIKNIDTEIAYEEKKALKDEIKSCDPVDVSDYIEDESGLDVGDSGDIPGSNHPYVHGPGSDDIPF